MRLILLLVLVTMTLAAVQPAAPPRINNTVFELTSGQKMTYGLSIPAGHETAPDDPRPLVLALHPGGSAPYYGSNFMANIVEPALRDWRAIVVAPDVPARRWNNDESEQAVLDLVADIMTRYAVDPARVLVTGFSMGGRGTWFFATRHPDLFTGAIPIAASLGDAPLEGLGTMPVHIIHSPQDEVVPFGPARETADALMARRHRVGFISVDGAGHYGMGAYVEPLRQAGDWMWEVWASKN